MNDEADLLNWQFEGILAVSIAVNGIFTKKLVDDVGRLKDESSECRVHLANFKAEVARDYARDANVQTSLARYGRLDRLPQEIIAALERRK